MDESAFLAAADATLERIGLALDAALETSDAELDWSLNDGVLTIECDDESRIIVNRHLPNREIWVAAKSGGYHFRAQDGRWRDVLTGDDVDGGVQPVAGLWRKLPIALLWRMAP